MKFQVCMLVFLFMQWMESASCMHCFSWFSRGEKGENNGNYQDFRKLTEQCNSQKATVPISYKQRYALPCDFGLEIWGPDNHVIERTQSMVMISANIFVTLGDHEEFDGRHMTAMFRGWYTQEELQSTPPTLKTGPVMKLFICNRDNQLAFLTYSEDQPNSVKKSIANIQKMHPLPLLTDEEFEEHVYAIEHDIPSGTDPSAVGIMVKVHCQNTGERYKKATTEGVTLHEKSFGMGLYRINREGFTQLYGLVSLKPNMANTEFTYLPIIPYRNIIQGAIESGAELCLDH